MITCDEIIEETKIIPENSNKGKVTCKIKNFFVLFIFLLIAIVLLIAVSIYCYLIKYQPK